MTSKAIVVRNTRQASKEDLQHLVGYIGFLLGAHSYLQGFYFKDILKRTPICIQVYLEENNGNIDSLHALAREIMASA